MQAILTKKLAATNKSGVRIKATLGANSITQSYDFECSLAVNHANAAQALAVKLGITKNTCGSLSGGTLPNGDYAFVFSTSDLYCYAPDAVN